ncbi:MAG: AhpC/TSA family protein [Actinomycetota bacterium]
MSRPGYPRVVFVYQGTADQGPMFFDGRADDVEAIADPDATLHASFAVRRGGLREMFGLRAWRRGLTAVRRGHFINRKIGDPWTLPTVIAVADGRIVWQHRGRHAGDHPDVSAIPQLLTEAA